MIIGVALVVDDIRKGQRLAFRYPESVPSSVINSSQYSPSPPPSSFFLSFFLFLTSLYCLIELDDRLLRFHEEYLATRFTLYSIYHLIDQFILLFSLPLDKFI